MIFGSLAKRVTISYKLLTDSKTLSSKTVVNSCSMLVKRTVMFNESRFNYFLKSWLKLNLSRLLTNSLSYKILRILVSIFNNFIKYFTLINVLRIIESFLEIAENFSFAGFLKLIHESFLMVVLVVACMESIIVIDTESSSNDFS